MENNTDNSLEAIKNDLNCEIAENDVIEDLKKLPKKEQKEIARVLIKQERFSGPLPHPKLLKAYDEISPGAAEKILNNSFKESDHRRELNNLGLKYTARDNFLAPLFGFILGMTGIIGGVVVAIYASPTAGFFLSGGSLVMLVSLFVKNNKQSHSSDDNNQGDMVESEISKDN